MTTKEKRARDLVKKGLGVGAVAMRAILDGKDVDQTLAAVKRAFPKAKASATRAGVMWYRGELKRRGVRVPPLPRRKKAEAK